MLVSLLVNHAKGREIEIYVLATHLPEEDRRKIEISLRENRPDFDLASLHWLSPSLEIFQGLPITHHADIEVYSRLLAPRVLPEHYDKIIYLDCDMVILTDLSPLYDSMRDDSAIHAVRDQIAHVSDFEGVFNYAELGIPPKTHYFNSGVVLINLKCWREQNITERIITYLKRYQGSVWWWDQGGMNAILYDSWAEIDPVWNQMRFVLFPKIWEQSGQSMADRKRTLYHPKIVHYTTHEKPWIVCPFPGYSYFFKYLEKTGYRGLFKGPRLEHIIGFRLNYILWRAKIFLFWKRSPQDFLRVFKRLVSRKTSSLTKH